MAILATIIASSLILLGFIGVLIPALPGIPLILIGTFVYGILTNFEKMGITFYIILIILTLFTLFTDYLAIYLGAKRFGVSKLGIILGILGGIIGLLITNILGVIIGPLIGVILGELIMGKNVKIALKNSGGAFIGFLAGTLTKVAIALIMIGLFVANILF